MSAKDILDSIAQSMRSIGVTFTNTSFAYILAIQNGLRQRRSSETEGSAQILLEEIRHTEGDWG